MSSKLYDKNSSSHRFRLRPQLSIRKILIFFIGLLIFIVTLLNTNILQILSGNSIDSVIAEAQDIERKRIIFVIENYYSEHESWVGLEQFIKTISNPRSRRTHRRGRHHDMHSDPELGLAPYQFKLPPLEILLLDNAGELIFNSLEIEGLNYNKYIADKNLPAIIIFDRNTDTAIAKLYIDIQVNKFFFENRLGITRKAKFLFWLTGIFIAFLAILAASFIIFIFTKPLQRIGSNIEEVAKGKLDINLAPSKIMDFNIIIKNFNHMVKSLKHSEQRRIQQIKDVAHELRTPIALAIGQLEMISEGIYKADERQLRSISKDLEGLGRLVKDLESIYQISDSNVLQYSSIDLVELLNDMVHTFSSKQVEISCSAPEQANFAGDALRLRQVLRNLCNNSIRFCRSAATIQLSLQRIDSGPEQFKANELKLAPPYFEITVADNGIGIADEHKSKVFERFYRVEDSRSDKTGGSGLGLAISKEIILAHAGTIHAEDRREEGRLIGTKIIIRLPI